MSGRLKRGKRYAGKADRISGGGNLIVEPVERSHINLGQVSEAEPGDVVTFRYITGHRGEFLEKGVQQGAERVSVEDFRLPSDPSPLEKDIGNKNDLINKKK